MKNEIKDLIDQKKKNDSRKKKVAGANDALKDKIIREVNPILRIMNTVEASVMKEKQEKLQAHSIYNLRPIHYRISNIKSISSDDNLLKLKESNYACGEYYQTSYKIPLSYFDMTVEQITEAHTIWCNDHLEDRIAKANKNLINNKIGQIERLKQEIKKLKQYNYDNK